MPLCMESQQLDQAGSGALCPAQALAEKQQEVLGQSVWLVSSHIVWNWEKMAFSISEHIAGNKNI